MSFGFSFFFLQANKTIHKSILDLISMTNRSVSKWRLCQN